MSNIYFDSCSQAWIDPEHNAWSWTGKPMTWNARINWKAEKMAKKKEEPIAHDNVKNPKHYEFSFQTWNILDEVFGERPLLWNCTKYLFRAGRKGDYLEDLKKANAYLAREIMKEELRRGVK